MRVLGSFGKWTWVENENRWLGDACGRTRLDFAVIRVGLKSTLSYNDAIDQRDKAWQIEFFHCTVFAEVEQNAPDPQESSQKLLRIQCSVFKNESVIS